MPDSGDAVSDEAGKRTGAPVGSVEAGAGPPQGEDPYQALFLAHPDGIVLTVAGRIALVNDRFAEMSLYTPKEATGMAPSEMVVPEDRERAEERVRALLNKGAAHPSAYTLLRKDGAHVPVGVHSKPVRHEGQPAIISGVRDISEQKRAEDALRTVEQGRYRQLLEVAPDGIVIVDSDGIIETVNARTEELFGYGRKELIGRPVETLIPERYHERHLAHRKAYAVAPHARPMGSELGHYGLRKDGTEFPVDVNLNAFQTDPGISIIASVRDVTERIEAQKSLRESEARFSTAFHDNPTPVAISKIRDGKLIDVNDAFLKLTGYRRAETIGRTTVGLGLMVDPAERAELAETVRERGTVRDFPERVKKKTGEVLDVLETATQIELEGEPCFLITIVDITDRMRLEEELLEARDDIEGRIERQMDRGNAYKLTFREFTVLHLVAAGKADKEIAVELGISIFTVHRHVSKILSKMDSPSRTEAGTRALREGLLE